MALRHKGCTNSDYLQALVGLIWENVCFIWENAAARRLPPRVTSVQLILGFAGGFDGFPGITRLS